MIGRIKSAVGRMWRLLNAGADLLDEVDRAKALEVHFSNQNATMFGVSATLKGVKELTVLREDIQKANQLMNLSVKEFRRSEKDIQRLFTIFDDAGRELFETLRSYDRMVADLDTKYERARRMSYLVARSPQTAWGILGEETNAMEAVESFARDPELTLVQHLYGYVKDRTALDIGANVGKVTEVLLRTGFETYAFEPNPAVHGKIVDRCDGLKGFKSQAIGIGVEDGTFDLKLVESESAEFEEEDSSVYASFVGRDLPPGLRYGETIAVGVRSLGSLLTSGEIPSEPGVVKIDTEGNDLAVVQGFGEVRPEVVCTETWADGSVMGGEKSANALAPMVAEMRERGYGWFIHIFRTDGTTEPAFFVNWDVQPRGSWGNTFFFRDAGLFRVAADFCERYLPRAAVGLAKD